MNRTTSLQKLAQRTEPWDLAIIGGGATGVGIAVDAASRGYAVCLLEQSDFAHGTSSRSTKLVHGGVRYLQQGNISLVKEALHERGLLRQNAPHLVHDLPFIVPNYSWWEGPFYGIGMHVYDFLAGNLAFGASSHLSREEVLARIPTLEPEGLRGGVLYFDGQFDDARLLIDLAHTATQHGATLLNYAPVTRLSRNPSNRIDGLTFRDAETGAEHSLAARCVINATGAFADGIRKLDQPGAPALIAPSQGAHLVLDRSFLPGDSAIMVPRTSDGRVMFAIPWLNHTLLGTTDVPLNDVPLEPIPREDEIAFILDTAGKYLSKRPARSDILSAFAGIRPLVRAPDASSTAALSRDFAIQFSDAGLLTIVGGKWTTYRKMAEDCVDEAADFAKLGTRPCITQTLPIHGHSENSPSADKSQTEPLHPAFSLTADHLLYGIRHEMARTIDDLLARRSRILFLNARAALAMAPAAARLLAQELHRDLAWQEAQLARFTTLAQGYLVKPQ